MLITALRDGWRRLCATLPTLALNPSFPPGLELALAVAVVAYNPARR